MAGLFEGIPTQSPTGGTSTTEVPRWFQDLTYQQMMAAQAVADQPYQQYGLPRVAQATPDQQAAHSAVRSSVGAWSPLMGVAVSGTQDLTGNTAGFNQAMTTMGQAGNTSSVANVDQYMDPYMHNVTDEIARLGGRNLSENILPGVQDSFIRAGQFGSSRMGDIGSRAIRDTQEAVLGQQAGALSEGYRGALSTASADLSRQLEAGRGIGSLAGSEATRRQGALGQVASLGQQTQGLHAQDAAALQAIGQEERSMMQQELDAAYQNYIEQQQHPMKQLDWFQAQLRGSGQYLPTTTNTTGYTTQFQPSPLSQVASGYFALRGLGES